MDKEQFNLVLDTQIRLVENMGEINQTLKYQAKQLETHIKRTELLEERVTPVEDHVKFIQTMLKLLMYSVSIGASVVTFLKMIGRF